MEQMVFSENGEFVTIYLRISVVIKVGKQDQFRQYDRREDEF